jgi:hypothetical protein
MAEATATRVAPPATVRLELDEDTARALKALTGLGTMHFNSDADTVARLNGFHTMRAVARRLVEDAVWEALDRALPGNDEVTF